MKHSLLLLAACLTPSFGELSQMSDKTEWLGYFVGWETKSFDFGIGADGESLLYPKERGKRLGSKAFKIKYIIEEEIKGKWVRRQFLKENGLNSETEKGIDPKNPVVIVSTVTGDTKIAWTHAVSRDSVVVMPKVLEKKTENKIRLGVEFYMPTFYNFDEIPEERELKKKLRGDYVSGPRLKDGKKVKVKFSDLDDDITSEEFLQDGATALEVRSKGMSSRSFVVENGGKESGRINLLTNGPLYKSFKIHWMANMEKIGEKETYVTFEVE